MSQRPWVNQNLWRPPARPDDSWMERGACQRYPDFDAFFDKNRYPEAKRVCARCPVETECLRYALTMPCNFGVYGGTTPRTRKRMRRLLIVGTSRL